MKMEVLSRLNRLLFWRPRCDVCYWRVARVTWVSVAIPNEISGGDSLCIDDFMCDDCASMFGVEP